MFPIHHFIKTNTQLSASMQSYCNFANVSQGFTPLDSTDISLHEWDNFLETRQDGCHVQTSGWAELKALHGWIAERIVFKQGNDIIAGAQMLIRPLSRIQAFGTIAYIAKGPIICEDTPELIQSMLDSISTLCRKHRVKLLILQPPESSRSLDPYMEARGYLPSWVHVTPPATTRIDLRQDEELLFNRFGKSLRRNIRHARNSGIVVQAGGREFLDDFFRLLEAAGTRLKYPIASRAYYEKMWSSFEKNNRAKIFMSAYKGQVISAKLSLIFGDTIFDKRVGWSGEHGSLHPNELLDWEAIRWAKQNGLKYYDLEGIDYNVAQGLLEGARMADLEISGADSYKLKFQGEAVLFPRPWIMIFNPLARPIVKNLISSQKIKKFIMETGNRFRVAQ